VIHEKYLQSKRKFEDEPVTIEEKAFSKN
jgi:hypothetical protein